MTWDQAQKEALARATTNEVLKWAVELRHSLFSSPFRIINHDQDADITLEADAPANEYCDFRNRQINNQWTVKQGPTDTAGTGPSVDHSTGTDTGTDHQIVKKA